MIPGASCTPLQILALQLHPPSMELVGTSPDASVSYMENARATSSSVGSCGAGATSVTCGLLGFELDFRVLQAVERA